MRSLEECKNEVYLRSEKRIRKRRQVRSRVLALCIPLCLAVLSIPLFTGRNLKSEPKEIAGMANGNAQPIYTSAEIHRTDGTDGDTAQTISESEKVERLYWAIQDLYAREEACPEISDGKGSIESQPAEPPQTYRIMFQSQDHEQVCYLLTENSLINEATGEYTALTQAQFEKLQVLLAVSANGA